MRWKEAELHKQEAEAKKQEAEADYYRTKMLNDTT
jgi:hypothetical protein